MTRKIKSLTNYLRGVSVKTINPVVKSVFFLMPILSSRGDECRKYKKAVDLEQELRQKGESKRSEDEFNCLLIHFFVASLMQQYYAVTDEGEEISAFEAMKEFFLDSFVEDDLLRIYASLNIGEEQTKADLFDLSVSQGE